MALPMVVWHGTKLESDELVIAISRNCECEFGLMGVRVSTCAPHKALLEDQRWLDALIFYRRIRECLYREEGITT